MEFGVEDIIVAKTICLFNHKGGVSKTTTAFNLGWVLANSSKKVMMVDLDSQCNLTGLVLGFGAVDDKAMLQFYQSRNNLTLKPIVDALISGVSPESFLANDQGKLLPTSNPNLFLLPGHLDVSDLDSQISVSLKISSGIPATRNIPGNLPKVLTSIAQKYGMDYIIYDLSPNVGGLNEIVLMSSDYFIVPTSPDYFCLQAIGSLEKNISKWKKEIQRFKEDNDFDHPSFPIANQPKFIGAIQQRYRPRNERPAKYFGKWIDLIRDSISKNLVPSLAKIGCAITEQEMIAVLDQSDLKPYDLAHIPDFNSLIAISQQLSKPVFSLTDEDISSVGKVFGHAEATMQDSRDSFAQIFDDLGKRVLTLTS